MKDFAVSVFLTDENKFLASYLHPLTGNRVRKYFSSKQQANDYKDKTESQFRFEPQSFQNLTVEELLLLFLQDHPKSDFAKAKMHMRDFAETFGKMHIEELTTPLLKAWLDEIRLENGIKHISVRGIKCVIDIFFRYLVKREIISESPMTTIFYKNVARGIAARNILSRRQIEDLLASGKAYSPGYFYPILRLFVETAIKPNEVADLKWQQVNLEKKEITFPRTESSQERVLEISDELISLIEKKKKEVGPVFMTYYREPFTTVKVARLINEFKFKGSCKIKWTPMDLRHSYAVNFLTEGGDIRKLQYILGHWNVYETKRLYAEVLTKASQGNEINPFEIGS